MERRRSWIARKKREGERVIRGASYRGATSSNARWVRVYPGVAVQKKISLHIVMPPEYAVYMRLDYAMARKCAIRLTLTLMKNQE
jgi:hypothetical protein